jgi:hypothetical protein
MAQDTDEVRCPRGHLTSAKFPFCTECGAELNPQEAEEGVVRCPNGHVVTGGHKFCIECGAAVDGDEAAPAELADTSEPDDVPEVVDAPDAEDAPDADEVRCPKGHLTPAEYPYCIICGAELEKGAAAAATPAPPPAPRVKPRPVRKTVRRRPRPAAPEPTEEFVADEPPAPDPTETTEIAPPPPPRRAPRTRRPARTPAPVVEEPADEPEPAAFDEPEPDEPEELEDEPFLAPVPSFAASDTRDESVEHFVHTPGGARSRETSAPRVDDDRQKLIAIGAVVLALIAAVVVFFIIKGRGTPSAAPTPVPSLAPSIAPVTPAPTTKPVSSALSNVPMLVTGSSVGPGPGTNTYLASASIRNPTDFTAKNITVTLKLKDSAGVVIGAIQRTIAVLASGHVTPITVQGPDPGGKRPTKVDVTAVAAQLTR